MGRGAVGSAREAVAGPRRAHGRAGTLCTGVPPGSSVTYGYSVSTADSSEERRGRGRPRKWATEAERARAYRLRKAEEHTAVDTLRAERRELKRQLSEALRGRRRAEAALDRATGRAKELAADLERARKQLHQAEVDLAWLRAKNEELLAQLNAQAGVRES